MYERSTPTPETAQWPGLRRFLGLFPSRPASVRDARDWLRLRLDLARIPAPPTHDALLILSEITTNALLHAPEGQSGRAFVVSVFTYRNSLRISVRATRTTSTIPCLEVVRADPEAENGRGLFLVDALAATWGVERTRSGPAVYFTLVWDDPERSPATAVPRPRSAQHDALGR
ncbi:anti-sigma regulatory factor (Ser/Thr protein kinase) [Nocardiopsis sp. Huas11]|uniref:ATP-binding protein n=1 Tax=Nocardiopsis sp. Huas11 TaxID=2183912 RepID=UPI000EB2714B|nr:ATP-binding protein [Nocardiopsis sp. Huas11]RKS10407.1 anti-sigma regulatory factor (Ser/Thr protein kinase) [Nocardiopsis sp. Huas11]